MNGNNNSGMQISPDVIDMHVHVGIKGDTLFKGLGHFSEDYINDPAFAVFLLFANIKRHQVTDKILFEHTIETLSRSQIPRIVCLALDHYFDRESGNPEPLKSKMWVSNDFITKHLRPNLPDKVLFGCSVNPNDRKNFSSRTNACIDNGAVLMKWLPSSMGINLADKWVGEAMVYLASAKPNGNPLPLLLHVGPEHAIPPPEKKMKSYDYLSWGLNDRIVNLWGHFHVPDIAGIKANIRKALDAGAKIIFAHCGAPYFSFPLLKGMEEHSDFETVKDYLNEPPSARFGRGCFADISAFVSPMRKAYFNDIKALPQDSLLYGSDFPVPIFEISIEPKEWWKDISKAIKRGKLEGLIIPRGNFLDINYKELQIAFPDHPLFTNASKIV